MVARSEAPMRGEGELDVESDYNPHGFDGVWRMYLPDSKIKDPDTGQWVPEVLADQMMEIKTEGDVMEYRIRVDISEDLTIFQKYTCRFGDAEWAPYTFYHVEGDPNHPILQPNPLLKHGMVLGKPSAFIKQVYVDPRTQYRITRNLDGTAQYAMLRRLSEDGATNVGTVLTPDGEAEISKHFIRDTRPAPEWP